VRPHATEILSWATPRAVYEKGRDGLLVNPGSLGQPRIETFGVLAVWEDEGYLRSTVYGPAQRSRSENGRAYAHKQKIFPATAIFLTSDLPAVCVNDRTHCSEIEVQRPRRTQR